MSFQTHPHNPSRLAVPVGAAVSFVLTLATLALLVAVALEGVGLVEWGLQ